MIALIIGAPGLAIGKAIGAFVLRHHGLFGALIGAFAGLVLWLGGFVLWKLGPWG